MDRRAFLLLTLAGCADPQLEPTLTQVAGTTPPPGPAPAGPAPVPVVSGDPNFDAWLAQFKPKAVLAGVPQAVVDRETAGLTPDTGVVASDGRQPEFSKPVGDYVKGTVSDVRISQGRQFATQLPYLSAMEQAFRVPREIVLAIWAMESAFGKIQGDKDIVRCLATLAADGRRRAWAESELISALKIIATGEQTRARLKGSWAGAMGQTQFMPDAYLRLGVDQSGDGKVDIWGSDADALASAANLLARAGWKPGQTWGYEVILPAGFNYAEAEGPRHTWREWTRRGVTLARDGAPNAAEALEEAVILLPQGARGPAFLALPNHFVIRRYNNSVSYALAIGLTADGIAGRPGLVATWPNDAPLSRDQRIGAQAALTRLGFDTQGIDGVVGANTRAALRRWQVANGRLADGYLTADLADELIRLANQSPSPLEGEGAPAGGG
jgi:lytic murein transglycosylase